MDAIIIGGGHNGLVAAHYLARGGLDVTVLEQRSEVGGLCATDEIFPGFHANLGSNTPHNLEPRIGADMELERHGLRFVTVEPSSFMMFRDGRKLVGHSDKNALRDEIAKFARDDVDGYFETLNALGELGEVLDVSFFEPPPAFDEIVGRLHGPRQEAAFAKAVFGSVGDLVSERLRSEEMRASLAMVAIPGTLMGPSSPGSAYGLLHRPLYRGSNLVRRQDVADATDTEATVAPFSKATPMGGMGSITQAMAASVRASGVTTWHQNEEPCTSPGSSACSHLRAAPTCGYLPAWTRQRDERSQPWPHERCLPRWPSPSRQNNAPRKM